LLAVGVEKADFGENLSKIGDMPAYLLAIML
jgi:hypothetical protein